MNEGTLHVTIAMLSDWGVGTGTGIAGARHAGIEKAVSSDGRLQPVVRGTVVAGLVGEQARAAARGLDDGAPDGPWQRFAAWLFGSESQARHVVFSDAQVDPHSPDGLVHDVVSSSLDDATGTARQNFLRVFERAAPCVLRGTATLLGACAPGDRASAPDGDPPASSPAEAARFLLGLAGLLVEAIGSNRSDGDGECAVLIRRDSPPVDGHGSSASRALRSSRAIRDWARRQEDDLRSALRIPPPPRLPGPRAQRRHTGYGALVAPGPGPAEQAWVEADLDIELGTPLVSYDVPMSNEVRSLDFLRGTAVLAWLHRRLCALAEDAGGPETAAWARSAVVRGELRVSDALTVVDGARGLPVPLVFQTDKLPERDDGLDVVNRLRAPGGDRVLADLRTGFVFPSAADQRGGQWRYGAPPLTARQSTAHDPRTGAADEGRLYTVRALPAGMRLRATVTATGRVADVLRRLEGVEGAMLGSRRLSGAFGQVRCSLGGFSPALIREVGEGETTLWFTSDALVRSPGLGPGGTWEDLRREFARRGAPLERAVVEDLRLCSGAIRHRRIDSWSVVDSAPRATRIGIRAGSALRVRVGSNEAGAALARLAVLGVGELCPQGYGRFIVGDPLLDAASARWGLLRAADFTGARGADPSREDS